MPVVFSAMDAIDRDILEALIENARLTQRELGRKVGLSPNAVGARVQRLVERGIITDFTIRLDHRQLGRPIEALIDIWQNDERDRESFHWLVADDPRIVDCVYLTGPLDFRLRARVASPEDLNDLIRRMQDEGGVRQTDSRLVLEHVPTGSSLG